jgi:hypothetical protein
MAFVLGEMRIHSWDSMASSAAGGVCGALAPLHHRNDTRRGQEDGAGERCRRAGCTVLAIVVELTGEDTMKRVVLLPLLLMLAGCVTYEGVDQNGRRSKFGNLIECRQSSIACRRVPQNPKDQASDSYLSDTYMLFPK